MSSVAKGKTFEDYVLDAITQELQSGRPGLSPASVRLFQKKTYGSSGHGSDIPVDISIEIWPPNADRWSLLWVCKCSDDRGIIAVDEVAAFKTGLDRITGTPKKGVLAVSSALQEAALDYAKANDIGVIRLLPDDQVEHKMRVTTTTTLEEATRLNSEKFYRALTTPDFVSRNRDFYSMAEGYIFGSWGAILKHMLCIPRPRD